MRWAPVSLISSLLLGCTPPPGDATPALAPSASAPAATSSAPGAPAGSVAAAAGAGALFDKPEDAFAEALKRKPLVLAVGETHAQKATEGVRSTTARFTTDLLPLVQGQASDLIIELWVADPTCNKKKVAAVAQQQKEVTKDQAEGNQNEFVALGDKAKAMGIQPHVLRPTCKEYDEILAAGADGIPKMLAMIERLTEDKVKALLQKNGRASMVITYGGAMHNDIDPRKGREDWSFGPALAKETGGRYVEIDLIVPEFIKDNASWQSLPWYPHFERGKNPGKATLFSPTDGAYALIFPTSP